MLGFCCSPVKHREAECETTFHKHIEEHFYRYNRTWSPGFTCTSLSKIESRCRPSLLCLVRLCSPSLIVIVLSVPDFVVPSRPLSVSAFLSLSFIPATTDQIRSVFPSSSLSLTFVFLGGWQAVHPGIVLFSVLDSYSPPGQSTESEHEEIHSWCTLKTNRKGEMWRQTA